jgi:DNA-binding CsgD family transcriptional regulator
MLIENLTYLATFITTTGMAVIGSLVSYQLFREKKNPAMQILLYHQIFIFSFFIHAIWGNLAIRQVIADMNPDAALIEKLAFFIPLTGLPLLIAGWFMLLKFGFNLNGYSDSKIGVYAYFSAFLVVGITFAFLIQNSILIVPGNPVILLIRGFVLVNLFIHLLLSWPFMKPAGKQPGTLPNRQFCKCLYSYWLGVGTYSFMLWFTGSYNFISLSLTFLVLFGASGMLPVCLKFMGALTEESKTPSGSNFHSFCTNFEISKREAEIILEICSGKTNRAIADKLFITLQTVKDHTHHIYTKTNVKSRVQLANLVREKTGMNF